jgi:hypothetical protein
MKAPKNFEALFLAAAVLLNITAFASADETVKAPAGRAVATVHTSVAADNATQVVMVKAKRLTAAEKAALN